jgi:hypothetical protein
MHLLMCVGGGVLASSFDMLWSVGFEFLSTCDTNRKELAGHTIHLLALLCGCRLVAGAMLVAWLVGRW